MPSWESSVEKKLKIFPIGCPTATRNIAVQSSAQFFPGIDRILSMGRGFITWSNFFWFELWSGLFAAQLTLSKFHVQLHLRARNFKCSYLCLWKFMNVVLPINDYRSRIVPFPWEILIAPVFAEAGGKWRRLRLKLKMIWTRSIEKLYWKSPAPFSVNREV